MYTPQLYVPMVFTTYQQTITTHTFTRVDPGTYSGEFDDENKRCGRGTCVWANGAYYDGEWKDGVRHGRGRFIFADGTDYRGNWVDDIRDGNGIQEFYHPVGGGDDSDDDDGSGSEKKDEEKGPARDPANPPRGRMYKKIIGTWVKDRLNGLEL